MVALLSFAKIWNGTNEKERKSWHSLFHTGRLLKIGFDSITIATITILLLSSFTFKWSGQYIIFFLLEVRNESKSVKHYENNINISMHIAATLFLLNPILKWMKFKMQLTKQPKLLFNWNGLIDIQRMANFDWIKY